MRSGWMLAAVVAPCVAGCAMFDTSLPVLGTVEEGVYTHGGGVFSCPMPGPELGFVGAVEIEDAAEIIKTERRVIPQDQLRPGESSIQDVIIYPITYRPSPFVYFRDSEKNSSTRIEIGYRPLKPDERVDDVLTSGYSGGNLGLLVEKRIEHDGREYGLAVSQLPYWTEDMGYMGVNFLAAYLHGDDPGPDLHVRINVIDDDRHFYMLLRSTSLEFLPEYVNPKDLQAVYDEFNRNPTAAREMERRALDWMSACRFAPASDVDGVGTDEGEG